MTANNTGGGDVDWNDLNIVAIAKKPKEKQIKKKKNNKYERRRQKAAAHKKSLPRRSCEVVNDKNDDRTGKTKKQTESEQSPSLGMIPATEQSMVVGGKAKTSQDSKLIVGNDNGEQTEKQRLSQKSNFPSIEEEEKSSPSNKQKNKVSKPQTLDSEARQNPLDIAKDPPTTASTLRSTTTRSSSVAGSKTKVETQQLSSRRRHGGGTNDNTSYNDDMHDNEEKEQQHAQYMANFHARPMELDRRSGVRASKSVLTTKSKESFHLFQGSGDASSNSWESLNLHSRLLHTVTNQLKLTKPTTVQSRTIQTFFQQTSNNNNILIQSETGSGKTLAYLLPILQLLAFDSKGNSKKQSRKEFGTRCVILCPTRELASQTLVVLERLCQLNFAGWLVPGGLLGGDSRNSEKSRLRKGVGIIVATPGRLLDHLNKTESLLLSLKGKVQWLVLDECDTLMDMGLGAQVKKIVQLIRANEASKSKPWWRSVLVSATLTPSVEALAKERMLCGDQQWIWVKGGGGGGGGVIGRCTSKEEKACNHEDDSDADVNNNNNNSRAERIGDDTKSFSESTPRQLAQFHLTMTAKLRLSSLVAFLAQRVHTQQRAVVFFATCASVDYHYELLSSMPSIWGDHDKEKDDDNNKNDGIFGDKAAVFKLHGSVPHDKRNRTLQQFDGTTTKKNSAILLTTDVAARGLNLPGVDWTVQYDPPCEISDYVHRVGRVARAGKAGHSVLFLLPSERAYLDVLETKGVSNITAMSLSQVLNKAAELCPQWTNAGLKYGGGAKDKLTTKGSRFGEYFSAELQRRLEDCVIQDDQETKKIFREAKKRKRGENKSKEGKLLEMARAAFLSSLRAYPTKKEAAVRSIFSARALHLGHVARSFALKEPPRTLVSKHKHANAKNAPLATDTEKPRSMDFSKLDANLVTHSFSDDEDDVVDATRRLKHKKGDKKKNSSKALLLQNAMKMQKNLMDAM